jgi:hypothetical protein
MRHTLLIILSGIIGITCTYAQNETDALRFSERFFGTTARSAAMGGAFASLGGDFSSLGYNPAGIAVLRTTELTFSPSFTMDEAATTFYGDRRTENNYNLGLGNLGFIASFNRKRESGLVGTNFGVGYHRHNDFNRHQIVEGMNPHSSMADYFIFHPATGAFGTLPQNLDPFWERLAYDTYVIDSPDDDPSAYFPMVPLGARQREIISTSGNTGEWLFSFGANFDHTLYLGATFSIESVDFTRNSTYTETNVNDRADYYFEEFRFRRNLGTTGTGYTFKAGAIFTPFQLIRLGASVHLPTFYSLTDEWSHEMESWFASDFPPGRYHRAVPTTQNDNPIGPRVKDYSLTTPFRFIGGAGLMLPGQLGVISVDYEYVDYTSMRLRETDGGHDFYETNQTIQNVYRAAGNLKGGVELRFGQFLVRGGYAYYGSPYASGQLNSDANRTSYSGGFGFRERNFYIDLAFVRTLQDLNYLLYEQVPDMEMQPASGRFTNDRFLVTAGIRF